MSALSLGAIILFWPTVIFLVRHKLKPPPPSADSSYHFNIFGEGFQPSTGQTELQREPEWDLSHVGQRTTQINSTWIAQMAQLETNICHFPLSYQYAW